MNSVQHGESDGQLFISIWNPQSLSLSVSLSLSLVLYLGNEIRFILTNKMARDIMSLISGESSSLKAGPVTQFVHLGVYICTPLENWC